MVIAICGSMKFIKQMGEVERKLTSLGHTVCMPIEKDDLYQWSDDHVGRVEAKKKYGFIGEHMKKIKQSDAILVMNFTKNEIENYIGANTFLEIGFAYFHKKKVFLFNPIPNQFYIIDEIKTIDPRIINGDCEQVK